jgi:hypothetical protein
MKYFKKILIAIFICTFFLFPQGAKARGLADATINCASKTAYYLTKYTLKAGWFIARTTTKGAIAVTESVFKGTKDATKDSFASSKKSSSAKPKAVDKEDYYIETLPPAPKL